MTSDFNLRVLRLLACGAVVFALSGGLLNHRHAAAWATSPALTGSATLRVMSYNIHVGVGIDKQLDLARIAAVIRRERPDLVGLQEVDRGVERTGRRDEIAELSRMLGMEYAFAPNLNFQGGYYGVAVLSRFPILTTDHRRYANRCEAERRGLLRVEVEVGGRRINFVTTHLDYRDDDGRLFETEQLLRVLGELSAPLIVVGDFNDEPTGKSYKLMTTRFEDVWAGRGTDDLGLTYPSGKPVKRIDYIFHSKEGGISTKRAWVPDTPASDHLPLVAELEFR